MRRHYSVDYYTTWQVTKGGKWSPLWNWRIDRYPAFSKVRLKLWDIARVLEGLAYDNVQRYGGIRAAPGRRWKAWLPGSLGRGDDFI